MFATDGVNPSLSLHEADPFLGPMNSQFRSVFGFGGSASDSRSRCEVTGEVTDRRTRLSLNFCNHSSTDLHWSFCSMCTTVLLKIEVIRLSAL